MGLVEGLIHSALSTRNVKLVHVTHCDNSGCKVRFGHIKFSTSSNV